MKRFFGLDILGLFLSAFISTSAVAGTTAQTFTLDGQLYATGTTTPLLDATAVIKVQILDPSLTCLLYEQQHTVDTLTSNGYFNVEVGSDVGAIPPRTGLDPGRTMLQVYQNTSPITAANAPSQTCAGGVYTPANGHKRIVRVIVTPTATGTEDTLSPDIVMNSMPMAKVAESIQGIVPASLLQVDTSGTTQLTQANLAAAFTGTAYTNLQAVLAGGAGAATSVNASAGTVGAPSISFSGDTDTGLYSVGANQIGVTTGGVQRFIVDASGISSGTTGGAALSSAAGTAALPALSFAGDLDTGWWRPAANTMAASTGGAEQMRITSAGYVGIANTTPGSELDVKGTLRLTGATSGYLGLRAPATVTTPVTFTLPDGDSSPGYVLATNGSGTLSWAAPGGAASTTGLALGTVTAPSLSFSGDLNTGIWSPGAETVAVSTSGAERIRITPTGYVGIGTTTPTAKLELQEGAIAVKSSNMNAGFFAFSPSSGDDATFRGYKSGGTDVNSPSAVGANARLLRIQGIGHDGTSFSGNGNAEIRFHSAEAFTPSAKGTYLTFLTTPIGSTTAAERLRIGASGYVGIGTSAPGAMLDVKDTVHISGSTSGYVGLKASAVAGSTVYTLPSADGTAGQTLVTDGTGILSWTSVSSGTTGLALGTVTAPSISFSGDLNTGIWSPAAETVAVSTSGTEKIRITPTGYVGIGVTTPVFALHVKEQTTGSGAFNPVLLLEGASVGADGGPFMQFRNSVVDDLARIVGNDSGGFGGNLLFTTKEASGGGTGAQPSTEKMRITSSGFVGIGTTTPGSKLDVKGTLRLSGATSGYVGFAPAAVAGSTTYTLPAADGSAGQALVTDGTGILSWTSVSSGTTGLALGTVTAPSISFSGDLNTGIWSPAVDTVAISTSGAERLRINPSGYIGIGTTNPSEGFHLDNIYLYVSTGMGGTKIGSFNPGAPAAGQTNGVFLGSGSTISWSADYYNPTHQSDVYLFRDGVAQLAQRNGTNAQQFSIYNTFTSATDHERAEFNWLANANVFTIQTTKGSGGGTVRNIALQPDASGNVSIGHTNPGAKLDVKDTIRISGSTSGYVGLKAAAAAGSTTYTLPAADGTAGQSLVTDGTGVLSWSSGGVPTTTGLAVGTVTAPSISFSGDLNTGIWSPAAETVAVSTSGAERIRITPTGFVGIGTTNPTARLTLNGNMNFVDGGGTAYTMGTNSWDDTAGLRLSRNSLIQADSPDVLIYSTYGYHRFNVNSTAILQISRSGDAGLFNLGVNHSNPTPLTHTIITASNGTAGVVGDSLVITTGEGTHTYAGSITLQPGRPQDWNGLTNVTGASMYLGGGSSKGNVDGGPIYFRTTPAGASGFQHNPYVTAMTIVGNGNVGIGTTTPDEKLVVDNGTTIGKYSTGGWSSVSDARLKKDIKTLDGSLDKILKLRGVEYKFKKDKDNKTQLGFIAQEAETVFPEVVQTDKQGYKSMIYANLVAPLVEAVKELNNKISNLFNKSEQQEREIASLKSKANDLEKENAAIKSYLCAKDPKAPICKK